MTYGDMFTGHCPRRMVTGYDLPLLVSGEWETLLQGCQRQDKPLADGTSGRSCDTGGDTCGVDRDLTDEGNGEDRTLQMVTAAEG